jgi:hypothetical protein
MTSSISDAIDLRKFEFGNVMNFIYSLNLLTVKVIKKSRPLEVMR